MDELIEAINEALQRKGISAAKASQLAVGNPSAIKNFSVRRGVSRNHPIENLLAVAKVLDLELYLGPPRQDPSHTAQDPKNVSFVQRLDVQLSAGPGASADPSETLAPVAFRTQWMQDQGLVAAKCYVVGIRGDSMEPGLHDNDLAMIDTNRSQIKDGKIYAIVDTNGDIAVKRLARQDDQIILGSDNPRHSAQVRTANDIKSGNFRVIGQVVWSGHTWPK